MSTDYKNVASTIQFKEDQTKVSLLAWVGLGIFAAILTTILIALNGFVLKTLYTWFVVPVFSTPDMGLLPACGIYLLLRFAYPRDKEVDADVKAHVTKAFSYPVFALSVGWVIQSIM